MFSGLNINMKLFTGSNIFEIDVWLRFQWKHLKTTILTENTFWKNTIVDTSEHIHIFPMLAVSWSLTPAQSPLSHCLCPRNVWVSQCLTPEPGPESQPPPAPGPGWTPAVIVKVAAARTNVGRTSSRSYFTEKDFCILDFFERDAINKNTKKFKCQWIHVLVIPLKLLCYGHIKWRTEELRVYAQIFFPFGPPEILKNSEGSPLTLFSNFDKNFIRHMFR